MHNRILKFSIISIAALLLTIGVANAASSCSTFATPNLKLLSVNWGNSTRLVSASPGDMDVPLTVTLESYDTNCELENVEGQLGLYGGITDYTGSSTSTDYLQDIQPPSIFKLTFYLNIAKNISAGPNVIFDYPLVLSWDSQNGSVNVQEQFNIGVPLYGAPDLSYSVKNPDIIAGKVSNITINVTNKGTGYAYDINTAATSSSGVSLLSQPQAISALAPNSSADITLGLYVAPSQAGNSQAGSTVNLNLNTFYINPYGYNTTLSTPLGLFASSPSQASVLVSVPNQTLVTGRITNMDLIVSNEGTDPITNLSVVLTPSSPISLVGSDNLNEVTYVPPGNSVSLPMSLYVQSSSTSAVGTLGISLSYIEDNQQETVSRSISFLTPGYINMSVVSTTISPSSPTPGGIFSITSTINNVGSQSASATTVTSEPPAGITALGEATTFLGSIPVENPTAFTVSFTASSSAKAGSYIIPVKLSYTNNLNQVINQTIDYDVNISSSGFLSSGSSSPTGSHNFTRTGNFSGGSTYYRRSADGLYITIAIIAVVVAAIAGGSFYIYRRRQKAQKKEVKEEKKEQHQHK